VYTRAVVAVQETTNVASAPAPSALFLLLLLMLLLPL